MASLIDNPDKDFYAGPFNYLLLAAYRLLVSWLTTFGLKGKTYYET